MQAVEQIKYLNDFIEEKLCHTKKLMKEIDQNLGENPFQKIILEERLRTTYWLLQDMKAVMEGEI